MRKIILTATAQDIENFVRSETPEIDGVWNRVRARVPFYKREVYKYQAMILYLLAKQYNREGARILEIGTAYGYTAAILSEAAPLARIETLNPTEGEILVARQNLAQYTNVTLSPFISWEYLKKYKGPQLDMIFVDGDHKRIALDLPWWEHVAHDGLMCFHDFSPLGAERQCPPVFDKVTAWAKSVVRRPLDVLVFENTGAGFAGMYKQ